MKLFVPVFAWLKRLQKNKHLNQNLLRYLASLFFFARGYKNLVEEDNKYILKSLSAYQSAFRINQRKVEKEYIDLLNVNREFVENKNLYHKLKPEVMEEIEASYNARDNCLEF
jgi:hypothetical protein